MGSVSSIKQNCEEQAQAPDATRLTRALDQAKKFYNVVALNFGVNDLRLITRLLRCSLTGIYKVDRQTLMILGGALIYVVMPCDTIPDFIPILGYLDDAYVLRQAMNTCVLEIRKFQQWEQEQKDQ